MSRKSSDLSTWLIVGGTVAGGSLLLALAALQGRRGLAAHGPAEPFVPNREAGHGVSKLDIEAAARMLASENPRGSERLHIEQIWTQMRSQKAGQSIYGRITGEAGFGDQGLLRPVATTEPATDSLRVLAREVLEGKRHSTLPGAKKFFEPEQQDRAFAIAEAARRKQREGVKLSDKELRLLKYKRSAAQVRAEWLKTSRFVGEVDRVEFYS